MKKTLKSLVTIFLLFFSLSPVFAHTDLVNVEPSNTETLTVIPLEVKLNFSEPLIVDGTFASITSETGSIEANIRVEEASLFITVPQNLTGSSFTISYKTVASDGHPSDGQVIYQLSTLSENPNEETSVIETPVAIDSQVGPNNSKISWLQWLSLGASIGIAITFFLKMRKK